MNYYLLFTFANAEQHAYPSVFSRTSTPCQGDPTDTGGPIYHVSGLQLFHLAVKGYYDWICVHVIYI